MLEPDQLYQVTVVVEVSAVSPEQAGQFALDDLRDLRLSSWTMSTKDEQGQIKTVTLEVGD